MGTCSYDRRRYHPNVQGQYNNQLRQEPMEVGYPRQHVRRTQYNNQSRSEKINKQQNAEKFLLQKITTATRYNEIRRSTITRPQKEGIRKCFVRRIKGLPCLQRRCQTTVISVNILIDTDDMKKITHGRRTLSEYHSKIGKGLNLALSKIEMSGEQGLASMLEYVNQETGLNSRYTTAHYIVITRQWEHVVMTEGDITQMCRDNTTTNYAKNQWREDQQAAKRGKIPSSKNYNSYKVQRDTKIYNHSPTEGRNKEVLC
ncbi:uncharacterized protein LOC105227631 isoform X1 [Bactrocera dorsalis]|uniref:Uncharacterized protein LOC105227631 isoform X1 n=1 Tax=Bactrocera dorsalis TaxID=27457 RepID=A0ABM3IYN1_BACDO|nr:uncharacterized protein LOC105227631 isoform X1 [Bactrocera dorsalis]